MQEYRALVAGETLVDFLPQSSSRLADVETFARRPGGAPANVAVRLTQLGHPPLFWTRVGADPFGDFLVETLGEYGVPDRFVERDPDAKTTLAFVSEAERDEGFTFYRDGTADTRLSAGTVPDDVLAEVEWIAVGGVALASDPARTAIFDLVERARERGCSVLFDPNARPELWSGDDYASQVRRMLERTDVVTATAADLAAAGFEGDGVPETARATVDAGPHTVFVTEGKSGARAFASEDGPWDETGAVHDGFDVATVDATGAGDAFTAGVVAAMLEGPASLAATLASANRVAAASTTSEGGIGPLDCSVVES